MAVDTPVLDRPMFQARGNVTKSKGIAAVQADDNAPDEAVFSDLKARREAAAAMVAEAKQKFDPSNFQMLTEQERPQVFRPVAVNMPAQQPTANTAQQMQQMAAQGVQQPVHMAHGGIAGFAKGGLDTSDATDTLEPTDDFNSDPKLTDRQKNALALEKVNASRFNSISKLTGNSGIEQLRPSEIAAAQREKDFRSKFLMLSSDGAIASDQIPTGRDSEDVPSFQESWIKSEKAKDQAKWQARKDQLKGMSTTPLDYLRFGPRSDEQLQREFYEKNVRNPVTPEVDQGTMTDIDSYNAAAKKSAGSSGIAGITAAGRAADDALGSVPLIVGQDKTTTDNINAAAAAGRATFDAQGPVPLAVDQDNARGIAALKNMNTTIANGRDATDAQGPVPLAVNPSDPRSAAWMAGAGTSTPGQPTVPGIPGVANANKIVPEAQKPIVPNTSGNTSDDTSDDTSGNNASKQSKPLTGLEDIKAERSRQREENFNLALMQAGLAIAGGKSSNALTNIGEGGASGVKSFGEQEALSRKEYQTQAQELRQNQLERDRLAQQDTLTRLGITATSESSAAQRALTAQLGNRGMDIQEIGQSQNFLRSGQKADLDSRIADIDEAFKSGSLTVAQRNASVSEATQRATASYQNNLIELDKLKITAPSDTMKLYASLGGASANSSPQEYQAALEKGWGLATNAAMHSDRVKADIAILNNIMLSDEERKGAADRLSKLSTQTATGEVQHKVGDPISQNGKNYRVTAVDANGKVTAADPM